MDSTGWDIESWKKTDCEPRMHMIADLTIMIADLSSEKFNLHLSQCSVELLRYSLDTRVSYSTLLLLDFPVSERLYQGSGFYYNDLVDYIIDQLRHRFHHNYLITTEK